MISKSMMTNRVGLAVMEMQILHHGHVRLLSELAANCDVAIVGIGSVQVSAVEGHPFSWEIRRDMVESIFGKRFEFVPLRDIATRDPREWVDYVFGQISKHSLPSPTDYFCGSSDVFWYRDTFGDDSATVRVEGMRNVTSSLDGNRRLHVMDRGGAFLSGRDIRAMVENHDSSWKIHVPARVVPFVEKYYPGHLKMVLDSLPDDVGDHVVGTRALSSDGRVYELMDDEVWRPVPDFDEKAEYAKKNKSKEIVS